MLCYQCVQFDMNIWSILPSFWLFASLVIFLIQEQMDEQKKQSMGKG